MMKFKLMMMVVMMMMLVEGSENRDV